MKKVLIYFASLLIGLSMFTSCEDTNEPILLQDGDKFIAFERTTASAAEEGNAVGVLVYIAGVSGNGGSVNFAFDTEGIANPAVEGVDFTVLNTDQTLNFATTYGYDTIWIQPIDNLEYDKDKKVNIVLSNPTNEFNLGANTTLTFTVVDNEHPLSLVIGSYSATATSYFNGGEAWNLSTYPDTEDETVLWFINLVNQGTNQDVFGVVDLDAMTIEFPVGQDIWIGATDAVLDGFYGPSGADAIPTGGVITANIDANGNLTILDEFGAHIPGGNSWYNIYQADGVFTKSAKGEVANYVEKVSSPRSFR